MKFPNGRSVIVKENDYEELSKKAFFFLRMKSLLERLAPEECPTKTIMSYHDSNVGCMFCEEWMTDKNDELEHKPDCPWIEARKLLEELK